MHLSEDDLLDILETAKQKIEVGGFYRHYKSPDMIYEVRDIVIQEANNEPSIIYRAQYGKGITFSRPASVWLEEVELEGGVVQRFTKI